MVKSLIGERGRRLVREDGRDENRTGNGRRLWRELESEEDCVESRWTRGKRELCRGSRLRAEKEMGGDGGWVEVWEE